jgi:two-component system chemotaxis sensor kinase CheA
MDVSQYLPMFLAECRENLQELNLATVRLEEHPEDGETIAAIFRIAHSLKGMSGTMGFERMARLTHAMEDVFEKLRDTPGGLEPAAIDVVLACLDALSAAVDSIESGGTEALEPEPLIERLRALAETRATSTGEAPKADGTAPIEIPGDRRVVTVAVQVADESAMPSVRIYMVLDALGKLGEVLTSDPTEEALDDYKGRTARVVLATEVDDGQLVAALDLVGELASVTVEPLASGAQAAAPGQEPAPADEAVQAPAATQGDRRKSSTVRVDAERLDLLMHLMGELVVQRTRLDAIAGGASVPGLAQALQELARSSQALHAMVMQVRMIPVEAVFLRFPRLVRDLSAKLGKKVELTLTGQETELDRSVVEALADPLVHLVRNALDHGLETPEERRAKGKPEVGSLEISARHAGGSVLITVGDDGRGIDPGRVARIAAERKLIAAESVASVDMPQAIELLFTPGFSTAEHTTDVSGRGVGMDAVRSMVRALGGDVTLTSQPGVGTTAHVRMPLTLAIIAALLVESRGVPLAIPLERIERTLLLRDHVVRSVAGRRMLVLRDASIPLVDLGEALGYEPGCSTTHAVVVSGLDRRLALEVECLVGQRELVTRPLPDQVGRAGAFSGGAVLSNGEIALVLDCDALMSRTWGAANLAAAA